MSVANRVRSSITVALVLAAGVAASACRRHLEGCGCGWAAAPKPASKDAPKSNPPRSPKPEVAPADLPAPAPAIAVPAAAKTTEKVQPASKEGPERSAAFGRPGFAVFQADGRLWVFPEGSKDLEEFLAKGEPAKRVTRLGVGPGGRSVLSSDAGTIESYAALWPRPLPASDPAARAGFVVFDQDGRYWVFREGSAELAEFYEKGEPAKRVTRLGASPDGRTIVAPDGGVVDAYLTAAP